MARDSEVDAHRGRATQLGLPLASRPGASAPLGPQRLRASRASQERCRDPSDDLTSSQGSRLLALPTQKPFHRLDTAFPTQGGKGKHLELLNGGSGGEWPCLGRPLWLCLPLGRRAASAGGLVAPPRASRAAWHVLGEHPRPSYEPRFSSACPCHPEVHCHPLGFNVCPSAKPSRSLPPRGDLGQSPMGGNEAPRLRPCEVVRAGNPPSKTPCRKA